MSGYRYFSAEQDPHLFFCSATGETGIKHNFVLMLDRLRHECGFPFVITSGYRSPSHPIELEKNEPGYHTKGIAADIAVKDGFQRREIVMAADMLGFNGIGVAKTFVHVDLRLGKPTMWTYGGKRQ